MKTGRPTKYTLDLAKEICLEIATTSLALEKLCDRNPHWPPARTIYKWLNQHTIFRQMYANAKRDQVTPLVEEILQISDDSRNDTQVDDDGREIVNHDHINRARLRIDTRKWIAAKLVPRLYGDNTLARELADEIAEFKKEMESKGVLKDGNIESSEEK